jgi:hypothetical protein
VQSLVSRFGKLGTEECAQCWPLRAQANEAAHGIGLNLVENGAGPSRPARRSSADLDVDLVRFRVLGLGDAELEHPVLERRGALRGIELPA